MTWRADLILTPLGAAVVVSLVFMLVSSAAMLVLYQRRRSVEARTASQRDEDVMLSRQLLAMHGNSDADRYAELLRDADSRQKLRVFSHLLQLVRGEDHEQLLQLADRLDLPGDAIKQLGSSLPARRVDAMRTLEQIPVPRSIAALTGRLSSDLEPEVRLEAAGALARLGHLPPPAEVIAALELAHRPLNRLHEALFRASAATYRDELCRLSEEPSLANVRALLVEALGWSADFAVLPVIERHAADPDPEVRSAALRAARKLGHPGVKSWVLALLLDPVEIVRVQAARTSGALGLQDAIPLLASLVENPSWWVRKRAREALDRLRPAQPMPAGGIGSRT